MIIYFYVSLNSKSKVLINVYEVRWISVLFNQHVTQIWDFSSLCLIAGLVFAQCVLRTINTLQIYCFLERRSSVRTWYFVNLSRLTTCTTQWGSGVVHWKSVIEKAPVGIKPTINSIYKRKFSVGNRKKNKESIYL